MLIFSLKHKQQALKGFKNVWRAMPLCVMWNFVVWKEQEGVWWSWLSYLCNQRAYFAVLVRSDECTTWHCFDVFSWFFSFFSLWFVFEMGLYTSCVSTSFPNSITFLFIKTTKKSQLKRYWFRREKVSEWEEEKNKKVKEVSCCIWEHPYQIHVWNRYGY